MHLETCVQPQGEKLDKLLQLLHSCALDYDANCDFCALLWQDAQLIATASLDGCVIKCAAVAVQYRGGDLLARLLTTLRQEAFRRGYAEIFVYTTPANRSLFDGLLLYPVAETADCLLLESRRHGIADFVQSLDKPCLQGEIGAIVANCNPFTRGHLYLVEQAAAACDWLHLFILSENKGLFAPQVRWQLAAQSIAHLPNVSLQPTAHYLISAATFPAYFLRDKQQLPAVHCQLDLEIFVRWFAPALHITRRFVGSEPLDALTAAYNRQMQLYLPQHGIAVSELPRLQEQGQPVSASRVRALLRQLACTDNPAQKLDLAAQIQTLVTPSTWRYLCAQALV